MSTSLQHMHTSQCPLVFWQYDWHSELGWVTSCLTEADSKLSNHKRPKVSVNKPTQGDHSHNSHLFFQWKRRMALLYSEVTH